MQDRELYFYLLGLKSPWTVERVTLDIKNRRLGKPLLKHPYNRTVI